MYTPPAFKIQDQAEAHAYITAARLCTFVTATEHGLMATPLPLYLAPNEGPHGTLYGHLARANPQWNTPPTADALAIFTGPHAYISPSWYPSKAEHHKVVPTWNYVAVHAHGTPEFFEDPTRLLQVVTNLTALHEAEQQTPWSPADAPPDFIQTMLRGIIGLRLPITRLEAKKKMSQNRPTPDRAAVAKALTQSPHTPDQAAAPLIPT